jgi:hypothetical protein
MRGHCIGRVESRLRRVATWGFQLTSASASEAGFLSSTLGRWGTDGNRCRHWTARSRARPRAHPVIAAWDAAWGGPVLASREAFSYDRRKAGRPALLEQKEGASRGRRKEETEMLDRRETEGKRME